MREEIDERVNYRPELLTSIIYATCDKSKYPIENTWQGMRY